MTFTRHVMKISCGSNYMKDKVSSCRANNAPETDYDVTVFLVGFLTFDIFMTTVSKEFQGPTGRSPWKNNILCQKSLCCQLRSTFNKTFFRTVPFHSAANDIISVLEFPGLYNFKLNAFRAFGFNDIISSWENSHPSGYLNMKVTCMHCLVTLFPV